MIVISLYLCLQLDTKKYKVEIIKNNDSLNTTLIRKIKVEEKEITEDESKEIEKQEEVDEPKAEEKKEIKEKRKTEQNIQNEQIQPASTIIEDQQPKQEEIKPGTIDSVYVGLRFTGSMSAYGKDCCGSNPGMTSSGFDLKTSLYYYDSTYGNLRVLASDRNFKLYSVIKVTDPRDGTYNAIVLDRAGSIIGLNKPKKFDLAVESEAFAANNYGIHSNITFEVLRVGR